MAHLSKIIFGLLLKVVFLLALINPSLSQGQRRSTSVNVNNGKTTISIKNGFGNNFSVEYKGDIELSDDDTDVVSISRGGYMEIKKTAFGSRRKILIEPNGSGVLIKKYYLGGSQKSFDSEGKKWLSEVLLEVVRTTTLGAEKRVDRMYRKEGYYPVLKEVDVISSDHVKSRYLRLLLDKKLDEKGLIGALKRVGNIDSDHHKAEILKNHAKSFLASDALTTSFINTTGEIDSDHHKTEVLKRSIEDRDITDNQMKVLFGIAEEINSDHHKASILLKVLDSRSLNQENTKLLITTAKTIDSDHHMASVLKKALLSNNLSSGSYHTLLSSVDNINSDHHMASVLLDLLSADLDNESLTHLLEQVKQHLNSDMHQATVLRKVAKTQNLNSVLESYLTTLKSVNSDHHKAEVFKTLSRKSLSDNDLIQILNTTSSINSDHHHAEALISFASMVNGKPQEVINAYNDSANKISSDSHMGRVLRAIR